MKKLFRIFSAGALVSVLPFTAFAANTTGAITVSATVASNCSVNSPTIAFGSVNSGSSATNIATQLQVTCNKGVSITSLLLDDGAHASGTQKRMTNGTDNLNYNIDVPNNAALSTCPGPGSLEWNGVNSPSAANLSGLFSSSGGPKNIVLCASIPAGQFVSTGAYTDSVVATLTYN